MLQKYQLPNGLKVILLPSHKSPVVTVHAWVRTGSADELKGEEGISHFIEHLLFKGTRKFKVGEIASLVEGCGGEINAYTSFDQTVFHITLSKHFADRAVESLADMMGFPAFDPKETDNEREVVIDEIKRSNDSPQRASSRLLFETVYKTHPYRIPVIGYEENIRKFTPQQIQQYYKGRYSPQNMSLLVVGDFQVPEMKELVKSQFGAIPKTKIRVTKRIPEKNKSTQGLSIRHQSLKKPW
jgi:zinc protease